MSTQTKFKEISGAEAFISLVEWRGKPAISKTRIPKSYRSNELDRILRTRRTREEAILLHIAKLSGVCVPEIYFVDPKASEIIMEYVKGILLKDVQNAKFEKVIYRTVGESAAKLHLSGVIHGDLTPKNVIRDGGRTVIIDFGLSFVSNRLEDRAEDLHLLKQSVKSSEIHASTPMFKAVLDGYESVSGKKELMRLTKQIAEIERRGRYARVD